MYAGSFGHKDLPPAQAWSGPVRWKSLSSGHPGAAPSVSRGSVEHMSFVGVDACRTGWIAVVVESGGIKGHFLQTIEDLAKVVPDAEVVAIDISIGLPASHRRRADLEARRHLGARRSSLFFTPVREALVTEPYRDANAASLRHTGFGISRQAYGLRSKIFEVEAWLPSVACRVCEVHPELSFTVMMRAPPVAPKKTWFGMLERRDALERCGLVLDHIRDLAATRAAVDDMLDAGAAAWTATRVAANEAIVIPEEREVDDQGRPVAIWA